MARLKPKKAFDHCATDYARYRPSYPAEVFDVLTDEAGAGAGRWAADVGAGTGIFSRLLADRGWRVLAVEPTETMLARAANGAGRANTLKKGTGTSRGRCLAGARAVGLGASPLFQRTANTEIARVCATAEVTGLADFSVALVTAAQAFHWFNPPYALAEFARILKPGGILALIWNNRDASRSPFVAAYETLIARYNPAYHREYRRQDWAGKIAQAGAFESARYDRFDHAWRLPAERFVGFSRSVSYIRNVLSREDRPRFEADLRELIREHFGGNDCAVPLRTDLWTARRR